MLTVCVGDVAVKFSLTLGKNTELWFITKVCLDVFTPIFAYIMLSVCGSFSKTGKSNFNFV
jgi:hypothetical protein